MAYLQSKQYLWNSGMFIFRLSTILERFARFLPEMHQALLDLWEAYDTPREASRLAEVYPALTRISFDYAIMEKEQNIAVIPCSIGWSDIGAWNTLERIIPADEHHNIVRGDHLGIDTKSCVIFGDDQLITTVGIENLIIVSTGDSLLICHKDRVQDIGMLPDLLIKQGREDRT
jgi:mannose-1-phosphate guanylyltransferase